MVAVVTPTNLGAEFDIGVLVPSKISVRFATTALRGIVALATAADYPSPLNDVDAATPAYVAAAIAAIPGSHVPATASSIGAAAAALTIVAGGVDNQTFTFQPNAAASAAYGVVQLATAADYPSPLNDVDAATPAYVAAAIAAIPGGHVPATASVAGIAASALTVAAGGVDNQTFTFTPVPATGAAYGVVQLAVAADYPQPLNDTDAVTPAYLQQSLIANASLAQMIAGAPDAGVYASPQDIADLYRTGQDTHIFITNDQASPVGSNIGIGVATVNIAGDAYGLIASVRNGIGNSAVGVIAACGADNNLAPTAITTVDAIGCKGVVETLATVTGVAYGLQGICAPLASPLSIGVFATALTGGVQYAGYFGGDIFYTGALIPSDENIKQDLAPVNDAAVIAGLMGVTVNTYRPMVNPNPPGMTAAHPDWHAPYLGPEEIGPIAQEIAVGFPNAVQDVNGVLCVRDRSITYATLRLAQIQQDAIAALTARVAALEAALSPGGGNG